MRRYYIMRESSKVTYLYFTCGMWEQPNVIENPISYQFNILLVHVPIALVKHKLKSNDRIFSFTWHIPTITLCSFIFSGQKVFLFAGVQVTDNIIQENGRGSVDKQVLTTYSVYWFKQHTGKLVFSFHNTHRHIIYLSDFRILQNKNAH